MTPRRILYHHRIRADDGQAVHVRELIGALRHAGHEVRECALVPKADGGSGAPARGRAGPATAFWRRMRLPRAAGEAMEIAYDARATRMLLRAARGFGPDLVYERHALHCGAGLAAARQLGVPLLLEVNAPMADEMEALGLLRFPRLARRRERAVLAGADAVLPVTEVLSRRLMELGAREGRCHVIGNAADPSRYGAEARRAAAALRARRPADAFALGFVGFMRPWHRLDLALEAMRADGLERVHLVLVGEGPALEEVRARAAALRLGERVHTMGVVPAAELPAHLCSFDATLIPAINPYASPLKLFDALAAGVPVLAPDQPNLRERIRDGEDGVLFAPGEVASLADRLASLVRDPERARALGEAGRRRLLECGWTWADNARRVVAIYEGLRR